MSGKGLVRTVKIAPVLVDPNAIDMLEDMVVTALRDAKQRLDAMVAGETEKAMGGMKLPPVSSCRSKMATPRRTSARLYVVCATEVPTAVIFRRGPSKQVQLIKWNLKTNHFDYGQWFKGRIYERRCDLSPSGDLLIYLAANQRKPYYAWTAISKPPYLTALALWPNLGTWGGGGLFVSEASVAVNVAHLELAEGFRLKSSLQCTLFGQFPGRGEDSIIHHAVLQKQGWRLLDPGNPGKPNHKADVTWNYICPEVYAKTQGRHQLKMLTRGIHQRNDSWYWIDYDLCNEDGEIVFSLTHADWADWGINGNLLFAKDGKYLI